MAPFLVLWLSSTVSCPAVLPDVEVLDVDILVGSSFPLAPQQEALFGRRLCGRRERIIVKLEKLAAIDFERLG